MVELLDITVSKNSKRRHNGNSLLATEGRKKRRQNQHILFLKSPLFGYAKQTYATYLATKNLFNEGHDFIFKAKGPKVAFKRMQNYKNRLWNK